jgi:hypothetical protein
MILLIGSKVLYRVSLFSIVCTKLINYFGRKNAFDIVESFARVDKKVRSDGSFKFKLLIFHFQFKKANIYDHPLQLFIVLSAIFFVNFSIFIVFVWSNFHLTNLLGESFNASLSTALINGINTVTYTIYETIYLMKMFTIYFRLRILRKYSTSACERDQDCLLDKLKIIGDCWDTICDCLDDMRFCYTVNTSYYIIHYTFNFVLTTHSVISYFFHENITDIDLIYMFLALTWTMVFTPFIIFMFSLSNEIKNEKSSIENQVQSFIHSNLQYSKVQRQAELLFLQFQHRQPKITCGFFEVNLSLLFLVLGMIYNYLLIIAQYELELGI